MLQLHEQDTPAFNTATSDDIYIVNDSTTPYKRVGDLSGELTDASGGSLANKYYNLIIWESVSEKDIDTKLCLL